MANVIAGNSSYNKRIRKSQQAYRKRNRETVRKAQQDARENVSINIHSIPMFARGFIVEGITDFPLDNKYHVLTNTKTCQEISFPQYATPWHSANNGSSPSNTWTTSRTQIFQARPRTSQELYDHVHNDPISYNTRYVVFAPVYFKIEIDTKSKRIKCDYVHIAYKRDNSGSRVIKDKNILRGWVHTEYIWTKRDRRHRYDAENSWSAAYIAPSKEGLHYAGAKPSIGIIKYNKHIETAKEDPLVLFPWVNFNTFDRAPNTVWYKEFKSRLKTFVSNYVRVLPEQLRLPEGAWDGTIPNIRYAGFSESLAVKLLLNKDTKDTMESLFNTAKHNQIGSKAVEKYAYRLIKDTLNSQAIFEQNFQKSVDIVLVAINKYVQLFDDPSFLHHVDYESVMKYINNNSSGRYARVNSGLTSSWDDALFKKFPRGKQYRLIADSIFEDGYYITDLERMITEIHQHPQGGIEAIAQATDTRDVKSLHNYHDAVVKVYNKIRYAPKPIDRNIYRFLLDAGLEIPETNLELRLPEDTNTIRDWGVTQSHCIGSYADRCYNKETLIMGVWNKDKEEWAGHIQMHPVETWNVREWRKERQGTTKPKVEYVTTGSTTYSSSTNIINGTTAVSYTTVAPPSPRIAQFYARRNSPVDTTVRSAVVDHLTKAIHDYVGRSLDVKYAIMLLTPPY